MKLVIYPAIVSFMGAAAVFITFVNQLPTWVLFIAWVCYFLFGKSARDMLLSFAQLVFGIALAALMFLAGISLQKLIGITGVPISVFVVMFIFIVLVERLNPLSNIPAYFLGLIIFFGLHPPVPWVTFEFTILSIVLGFLFGWGTDWIAKLFKNGS